MEYLFSEGIRTVGLIGAGGKSSLLAYLVAIKKRVPIIVTTSTKMAWGQYAMADDFLLMNQALPKSIKTSLFVAGSVEGKKRKIIGIGTDELELLLERYPEALLIYEADGAAGNELKCPGEHEPVIANRTDVVIAVTSMRVFARKISEIPLHRREAFLKLFPDSEHKYLTPELMSMLLTHPCGTFKGVPEHCRRIWFINKADVQEDVDMGKHFINEMNINACSISVIIGSLKSQHFWIYLER